MNELLFWAYLLNSILLITHEIDSAYWKEWELFKLPGGVNGFLIIHFPILLFILYGLIEVSRNSFIGFLFSLLLSAGGIFAFLLHTYFIRRGRSEFKTPISLFILAATFITSIIQAIITIYLLKI